MALFIALLSCLMSILMIFIIKDSTYPNLITISSFDIFFFWWISTSRIDYVRKQHMCQILAISIFFYVFWAVISLLYVVNLNTTINLVFDNLEYYSNMLGLTLTLLLIIVSIMPKGLLYGFSRLGRTDITIDICDSCDSQSYQNSEKDQQ